MKDLNCAYCQGGELLDKFGIKICDLSVSQLILFKEQSKKGRVIVAYKDHVSEIVDISEEERNAFMADVVKASNAIHKAFKPNKVNYGAYGDTGCHLHMHLVPKYEGGDEWGGVFQMNPGKIYLSDEEYKAICKSIDDFKNDLNEKAAGTVKVTTKIIKADTEFSDYDKIGYNSYYASDRAALEYFKKNKINIDGYDHVFLVNSFPELPRDYFALGGTFINGLVAMSYILYGDGATNCLEYCYNITETNWPAGLFLHEFLHGVESYGNAIGYPVPSPDGSGTYGYPDVDGWRTFYMDIVNNNVKKNNSYVGGVHPLVWRLPPSMFN